MLPLLLLAACGETGSRDVLRALVWPIPIPAADAPPADRNARARWDDRVAPADPETATLRLTLGSRRALAQLISIQGPRHLWRSGGGVVVATEGARVVATSGLAEVLVATRFEGPDPLADPRTLLARGGRLRRVVDLMNADREPDGMRFGLILDCRLHASEAAGVIQVEENCAGARTFTNRFWANAATGAIFRAEQWVGPGLAPLTIDFLSPNAS